MKRMPGKSSRRLDAESVPHGPARAEALAARGAQADPRYAEPTRLNHAGGVEEYRGNPLPEILGYGPQFVRKSPLRKEE
jgi:hypothetical protein